MLCASSGASAFQIQVPSLSPPVSVSTWYNCDDQFWFFHWCPPPFYAYSLGHAPGSSSTAVFFIGGNFIPVSEKLFLYIVRNKFSIQYIDFCRMIHYNCKQKGNCLLPLLLLKVGMPMKNTYKLSNKSDMKQFSKDLEQRIKNAAIKKAMSRMYDVTCPSCGASVKVPTGKSCCPKCGEEIDLQLDIKI